MEEKQVQLAEHTERFKKEVENCKSQHPEYGAGRCFAITTDWFQKAKKPIFVKQEAMGEITLMAVRFESELQSADSKTDKS